LSSANHHCKAEHTPAGLVEAVPRTVLASSRWEVWGMRWLKLVFNH
jgi:hypothetical protein